MMNRWLVVAVALLLLALVAASGMRNLTQIPLLDEGVETAWAQLRDGLRARAGLVPEIVEAARGAGVDPALVDRAAALRARLAQADLPPDLLADEAAFRAYVGDEAALGAVLDVLAEALVAPRAGAAQESAAAARLEPVRARIDDAWRDYAAAAVAYNDKLASVAGRLWHSLFFPALPSHRPVLPARAPAG